MFSERGCCRAVKTIGILLSLVAETIFQGESKLNYTIRAWEIKDYR
jgi:hypothetical protein